MKASKVKFWARLGQIAYFMYNLLYAFFEVQLPNHVPTEFSGKVTEGFLLISTLFVMIVFTEAIVRLIGYFAEILEERK